MRILAASLLLLAASCGRVAEPPPDSEVRKLGNVEVTAQLVEVSGEFPPNDLYNYAYVLKYRVKQVHRGKLDGDVIYVGHYNPLKPRAQAQDESSGKLGGDVTAFRAGDFHRLALEAPLDQQYMGGIIDKYFEEKGPRFWCLWALKAAP